MSTPQQVTNENAVDEMQICESTSPNEEKERKLFMQDLNKFMSENGKPLSKIPIMGYKELDLFQLFREVLLFGGFNEVVKNVGTWSKIWKRLANFDPSITDSSFRLKKNYERYLLEYEYKCKPEHRLQAQEMERQQQKRILPKDQSSPPVPRLHNHQHLTNYSPTQGQTPSPVQQVIPTLLQQTPSPLPASPVLSSPSLTTPSATYSPPISLHRKEKSSKLTKRFSHLESLATHSSSAPSSPLLSEDRYKRRQTRKAVAVAAAVEAAHKIPRDGEGLPILPVDLGDLVLESLGMIVPRAPYVTEKHVWPVGFQCSRTFSSMQHPENTVKYTCTIVDGGEKPLFVIKAEDDSTSIQSHSPSGAWRNVLRNVAKASSNNDDPTVPLKVKNIDGTWRFGLSHPVVMQLLKELPEADKCVALSNQSNPFPSSPILSCPSSPSTSPLSRKRKGSTDLSSSDDNLNMEEPLKFPRIETVQTPESCEEIVFNSREELDDLENAVATLNALKFCTVY